MTRPPRDTALFFDLENLLSGYGVGLAGRVEEISVPDIVDQITLEGQTNGFIREYAVKRAYADWSKGQLAVLRRALMEQGIEPRQIFAFGGAGKTNAADIELVIDVLDLAYTRPDITTFVVVSGDGGFGTLVRKLHEFGKSVVVCAYKRKAAKGLRAVADHFVELDALQVELAAPRQDRAPLPAEPPPAVDGTAVPGTLPASTVSRTSHEAEIREVLAAASDGPVRDPLRMPQAVRDGVERLSQRPALGDLISRSALHLPLVGKALGDYLDRSELEAAFRTLSRLCRVALAGSPWCLATDSTRPDIPLLAARDSLPAGYIVLGDLPMPDAADRARGRLRANGINLPEDPEDLPSVVAVLAAHPIAGAEDGGTLMDRLLQDERLSEIETTALRQSISVLRLAGVLDGQGEGTLSDMRFEQVQADPARMLASVRDLASEKHGSLDGASLDALIPPPVPA